MPQFSIHWKGIPHHHLPRIRVSSPDLDAGPNHHLAHIAAFEAGRLPHNLSFRRARLQQRSRVSRRTQKSGRFPLGITSPIRIAYRTMYNTRLSRQGNPQFDNISKEKREGKFSNKYASGVISTSVSSTSGDVVTSIKFLKEKGVESATADNLTHPANKSASDKYVDIDIERERCKQKVTIQRGRTRHSQIDSEYNVCKRNRANFHDHPPIPGCSRTYDHRIPIRKRHNHTLSKISKYDMVEKPPSTHLIQTGMGDKRPTRSHLSKLQAIDSSISRMSQEVMAKPLGLFNPSPQHPAEASLRNFRRGLERHLIAQEAIRKACLSHSSSLSLSTLSANTVVELVPYIAEFNAAGLAVTSHEQRGALVLHNNDIRAKNQDQASRKLRLDIVEPIESHDGSGGDLYSIIKPTGGKVAGIESRRGQVTALADSNQNIISKKLRLPWLRKARQATANCAETSSYVRPPSASTCETCATTIIDFTPHPLENDIEKTNSNTQFIRIPLLDMMASDTNDISLMTAIDEVACPVMAERPVCTVSGGNTPPRKPLVDLDHYTTSTATGFKSKGNGKPRDESSPQSSRVAFSTTPSTILSHSFSPFRASAKLYASQKLSFPHDLNPANSPQHVESAMAIERPSLEASCPARSPPVPPKDHILQYAVTSESPDIAISHEYSFETPSVFERALRGVVNKSKLLQDQHGKEAIQAPYPPFGKLIKQGDCDPVKRKSAPQQPRKLSSDELDAPEISSLGFANATKPRATISKDHSDIRDEDIAKGLQVALAAAYDKELDLQVMEMSGHRVRKLLFDLKAFEGLGVNDLRDRATRTARLRREEHYQEFGGNGNNHARPDGKILVKQASKKRNEKRRPIARDDHSAQQGLLVAEMLRQRGARAGETVLERAVAMGWRNRSVSAGN